MQSHPPMPTKLSGVIFDCDGVILNSRSANKLYYNKVLEALGLPPQTPEQEAFTFMSTVRGAFEYLIPKHLYGELEKVYKTVVNYQRDILPHIELEDNFLDFITFLKEHNIKMAVHTNRYDGMQAVLDTFKLHGFFDPVITAADATPKPAPDGIFKIIEQWQVPSNNVFFVGDSLNDQQAALAGQMAFVAYKDETLAASLNVDSFSTLKKLLNDKYI